VRSAYPEICEKCIKPFKTKTTRYEKFGKKWPPLRKKKMSNTRHDLGAGLPFSVLGFKQQSTYKDILEAVGFSDVRTVR
jgi:hypothetical protein